MIEFSEMPERAEWERHLDVPAILGAFGVHDQHGTAATIADFGCGYGTFSLAIVEALEDATVVAVDLRIEELVVGRSSQKKATLRRSVARACRTGAQISCCSFTCSTTTIR